MNLRRIILEEIDDFQWIIDIVPSHPEQFESRLRGFIDRFGSQWENFGFTYEPIFENYGDLQEVGRVWMDEFDDNDNEVGSWYWDFLVDNNFNEFVVELYEKHADSYEAIEYQRFKGFDDAMTWIFETMAE